MFGGLHTSTRARQTCPITRSKATTTPKLAVVPGRSSRYCEQPLLAGSAPVAARHVQKFAVKAVAEHAVEQAERQELVSLCTPMHRSRACRT
jgi:hypothetical protein